SYCSRRFGGATCDDKSAQIYARFDKNDWRIQPAEFYRFHDAEVNTFGYLDRKSGSAGMPRPISYAVFCLKKKKNEGCRITERRRDTQKRHMIAIGLWQGEARE